MNATTQSFLALTAKDLMAPVIVTIPEDMTVRAAATVLAEADLRGAPVVDDSGHCVGVVSTTDFLYWAIRSRGAAHQDDNCRDSGFFAPWQLLEPQELPEESIRCYMNKPPRMVASETTIGLIARTMADAHIHRLIVVEEAGRVVGIISGTDLLNALAKYAEAMATEPVLA